MHVRAVPLVSVESVSVRIKMVMSSPSGRFAMVYRPASGLPESSRNSMDTDTTEGTDVTARFRGMLPKRLQCGYNNHMKHASIVGSRELKTHLGRYLQRVRRGETILITDRREPVAELRPLSGAADPTTAALRILAAAGVVTLPTRPSIMRFAAVSRRGGTASAAVSDDRDDRG